MSLQFLFSGVVCALGLSVLVRDEGPCYVVLSVLHLLVEFVATGQLHAIRCLICLVGLREFF